MNDLAVMIMSLDSIHLTGIGLATASGIGLITYGILRRKPSKTNTTEPSVEDPNKNDDVNKIEPTSLETSTALRSLPNSEESQNSKSNSLEPKLEKALTYDSYGSREEAIKSLLEAIEQETNSKEKVRLHVIYKNYTGSENSLLEIINRFPPVSKNGSPSNIMVQNFSEQEEKELFSNKTMAPNADQEATFNDIAKMSELVDAQQKSKDEEDTENFFKEFGHLANKIKDEIKEDKKSTSNSLFKQPPSVYQENDVHDVWANYMSLYGGRMNLKNTFLHLENAWGTIASIAELQDKINHEIGKDELGNQIPWAIISVLPLRDH